MKYKDLITRTTCVKLMMVSFATPEKNLQVFRFVNSLEPLQKYLINERNKLVQKYGRSDGLGNFAVTHPKSIEMYQEEMGILLNQDVTDLFPTLNLTEDDFSDDKCSYPPDKELWLNARELKSIFDMINAINERDNNDD